MWALCALAGLCGLLAASGCSGGSTTSSIRIPPAKGRPKLPPSDALVLAKEEGRLAVALAARPSAGGTELMATIVDSANMGKDGLQVSFRRGKAERPAKPCGSGCYSAQLPAKGPRAVEVRLGERTVDFRLPAGLPARDAGALVRRATLVYRRLKNVSYSQRLASAPGVAVFAQWREAAPDRFEYTIPGGASGVVIGARRWDRTAPSSRWEASTTSPSRMPTPIWGFQTTNAHVLGHTTRHSRRVVTVSLLAPSLPAWFTIDFDARTLRPLSLKMTAAAHFMHNSYTSFNSGAEIRPPR
jgi:hypothetical protein